VAVAVSASVSGLTANSTYHVRLVATNAGGTSYGADSSFATKVLEPPELGRCLKLPGERIGATIVHRGAFTDGSCLEKAGSTPGGYEWYPGAARARFTTALKEGVVTFETATRARLTCKGERGVGTYSGSSHLTGVVLRFSGCEAGGRKCTTAGRGEGELESSQLEGGLGWEVKATNSVAIDLHSVGSAGPFMEYSCAGGGLNTITGSVLAQATAGRMLATSTLFYKAKLGAQRPAQFEGESMEVLMSSLEGEPFEQTGEMAILTLGNEEPLEINTTI
jgi:hypothetical protein